MTEAASLPVIDTDRLDIAPARLLEALRAGHRRPTAGLDRCYLAEPRAAGQENGFLLWPAWQHGTALGAKLATIFPGNDGTDLGPTIRSVYLLFDGRNGAPLALITGEAFTRHKTAADSALGADLLSRPDAAHLVVLGAGAQAQTHIRYMLHIRPGIRRVTVWNRTPAKALDLAGRLVRSGLDARAAADRADAVAAADIVCCLTGATEPVLEGAWLRAGTHVDLVGGFTPRMRECDDATVTASRIFVDHRGLVLAHAGDIRDPLDRGVISGGDVLADLFDLCAGAPGRAGPDEITLFKNGGGGHLDLMAALAFRDMARAGAAGA